MASRARREQTLEGVGARPRIPMSEPEIEAFYRSVFLPLVRRATWKHCLSPEDASDIVQDAFLLALGKIDRSGHPKSWLVQVVDHLAMNHRRKVARRAQLASRWIEPEMESHSGRTEPSMPDY
ncbi:MAG TPA: sigma-70 family RNA polymerase sigma factor [Thermoanaerobaculia bacterium]|jgi:DNA-directed RNA polymerase specialized sigma24 family protein